MPETKKRLIMSLLYAQKILGLMITLYQSLKEYWDYIEEYYEENVDHKAQPDKLVQETMTNLDKISKAGVEEIAKLLKSLNRVSETLKADSILKVEMKNMVESKITTSTNIKGTNLEEAKLLAMSKLKLIKVVHEEASNVGIDLKVLASAKGGQEFKKIQDAKLKVLNREHSQKVNKAIELKKKRIDNYMWTTTTRLKPEPITDVKIHPSIKPAVISVYRGTNRRNFEVHNPFKFGDFRITKLDELN
nr:hypothetical protein [Tanacetum cinerariifolium]